MRLALPRDECAWTANGSGGYGRAACRPLAETSWCAAPGVACVSDVSSGDTDHAFGDDMVCRCARAGGGLAPDRRIPRHEQRVKLEKLCSFYWTSKGPSNAFARAACAPEHSLRNRGQDHLSAAAAPALDTRYVLGCAAKR